MRRRHFLAGAAGSFALLQTTTLPVFGAVASEGKLKQSVARWCFDMVPFQQLVSALQDMGVTGMDFAGVNDWQYCKEHGILPCMVQGAGHFLPADPASGRRYGKAFGWNKPENHEQLIKNANSFAGLASDAGVPNIIGLFGDREGMSDEEGIRNCVAGIKQIVPMLEEKKVTLAIEVLNSIVDHPDYIGNNTAFGLEVCKQVNSERVKLVYDAYHMQIMEGNLISTLRNNIDYIAHVHIAGVPGRHEIDERQEVNWRAIAETLADLKFQGYVAHEWIPT
ncbi:MAG: TIM barrel protein, partial [Pseudomonadota bacterium]